ncbi:MAG: hypothetical protein NTW87_02905 [Planctomycetota bacterium]|nr:hypothetical protein [Planctomycetota bacterium]
MSNGLVRNGSNRPRGSALIVALAIVLLLASVSTVLMMEMTNRAKRVEVDLEDIKAFEAAEAGIDAALNDINTSPVYQPYMAATYQTNPNASRDSTCTGVLNASGHPAASSGYPLISPSAKKPVTVHVAKKSPTNCDLNCIKPGCLGTSQWTSADDLDGNKRPSWRSQPMRDATGHILKYTTGPLSGQPRYCEDNIVPQALGNVAFFTYAIDWFHDGVDNDGDGFIDNHTERNKYTVYSTGIHRGLVQSGVSEAGKVVTIEVVVQAMDKDTEVVPGGPLETQYRVR